MLDPNANDNRHQRPDNLICNRHYQVWVCTCVGSVPIGAVMPKAAIVRVLRGAGANIIACS